jgi:hypothetical protein
MPEVVIRVRLTGGDRLGVVDADSDAVTTEAVADRAGRRTRFDTRARAV